MPERGSHYFLKCNNRAQARELLLSVVNKCFAQRHSPLPGAFVKAQMLAEFLSPLEVLPFDEDAAESYGEIRAALEKSGKPIGPLDTLIAGHALSLGATLITNNVREFQRVKGLKLESWT